MEGFCRARCDSGGCLATKRAGDDDRLTGPINRGSPCTPSNATTCAVTQMTGGILDGCFKHPASWCGHATMTELLVPSVAGMRGHAPVWCARVGWACLLAGCPYCVCTPCRLAAEGYDDQRGTSGNRDHLPHVQRRAHGLVGFHNGSRVLPRLRLLLRRIPWAVRIAAYALERSNVK